MVVITCQRCTVFSFKIHFSHWRQELRYPARILKSIQTPWLSPFQEHLKRIKDLFARRGQEMTDSCLVAELHTWDYVSTSDWKKILNVEHIKPQRRRNAYILMAVLWVFSRRWQWVDTFLIYLCIGIINDCAWPNVTLADWTMTGLFLREVGAWKLFLDGSFCGSEWCVHMFSFCISVSRI